MSIKDSVRAELRRRQARESLSAWCTLALEPAGQVPARHHRLLIEKLEAVARGEIRRLLVTMPPGSAKSTYSSILFPAWFIAQANFRSVVAASHTAELAEQFSRRLMGLIRDNTETLGYGLASESVSAWQTTNGCQYVCVGVSGPIAGRRADLAIIDDPIKSRAQADSAGERDRVWSWFSADLRTRLRPGAAIVLIMTRWHEDDLGGRLLQSQRDQWDVVNLPAIAGENDPLGREPGQFLWSDDGYGYGGELAHVLEDYQSTGAMRDWSSLYQQDPRPAEGALFKTDRIKRLDIAPDGINRIIRGWDLAATRAIGSRSADWSVGVKLGRTNNGSYIVLDIQRLRGDPSEIEAAILRTAQADGKEVEISLPQDPGQAGVAQAQSLVKLLAGFNVNATRESGDKATRASPIAAQINIGNVSVVVGPWTASFVDELAGFPSSKWDDQVDALARSFNAMTPLVRSQGLLELVRRDLAKMHAEAGGKPEPIRRTYQPGSVEFEAAERARIAEELAEIQGVI